MATKKKGLLTTTSEWVNHLRKNFRRKFWKNERQASKKQIQKELSTDRENLRKEYQLAAKAVAPDMKEILRDFDHLSNENLD